MVASLTGGRSYNQDFAVYDSKFYISSPRGNIVWGYLKEGTSTIIGSFVCCYQDSTGRFALGELEGMEFDSDGHLYAVDYIDISGEYRNAFVVELPINTCVQYETNLNGNVFAAKDATLTLSEASQKCFSLNTYLIRSLSQLKILTFANGASNISVPANNSVIDEGEVVINKDLMITLGGTLTVGSFSIYGGNAVFIPADTSGNERLVITGDGSAFGVQRGGRLTFSSRASLHISTPNATNLYIYIGYSVPITVIGTLPTSVEGKDMKIGSTIVTQKGLYRGSTLIG